MTRAPRGGQATYHGPGQIILYPIIGVRDLKIGARRFVENLEDVMIHAAQSYGVTATGRTKCATGVWVGDRKLGAIGVRISEGISSHGLAFNVARHLADAKGPYAAIVPCGMRNKGVTSIETECGRDVPVEDAMNVVVDKFAEVFGYDEVTVAPCDESVLAAFAANGE